MLIIKLSSLHFSPVILVFIYYLYVDIFPMYYREPTNPHNSQPRGRSIEIRSRPRGLSCRFVINQFDLIMIKMHSGMNCINQAISIIDSRQLRFTLLICSFLLFILSFIFLIDEASSAFSAIFRDFLFFFATIVSFIAFHRALL